MTSLFFTLFRRKVSYFFLSTFLLHPHRIYWNSIQLCAVSAASAEGLLSIVTITSGRMYVSATPEERFSSRSSRAIGDLGSGLGSVTLFYQPTSLSCAPLRPQSLRRSLIPPVESGRPKSLGFARLWNCIPSYTFRVVLAAQ